VAGGRIRRDFRCLPKGRAGRPNVVSAGNSEGKPDVDVEGHTDVSLRAIFLTGIMTLSRANRRAGGCMAEEPTTPKGNLAAMLMAMKA